VARRVHGASPPTRGARAWSAARRREASLQQAGWVGALAREPGELPSPRLLNIRKVPRSSRGRNGGAKVPLPVLSRTPEINIANGRRHRPHPVHLDRLGWSTGSTSVHLVLAARALRADRTLHAPAGIVALRTSAICRVQKAGLQN